MTVSNIVLFNTEIKPIRLSRLNILCFLLVQMVVTLSCSHKNVLNGVSISPQQNNSSQNQENLLETYNQVGERIRYIVPSNFGIEVKYQKIASERIVDVFFVDPEHGWVIEMMGDKWSPKGGRLFSSKNGGKVWNNIYSVGENAKIAQVYFRDVNQGILAIQRYNKENDRLAPEIELLQTSDGGKTWKRVFNSKLFIFSKFTFSENGEGWLVGAEVDPEFFAVKKGLVLHTNDYGKSWKDVSPKSVEVTFPRDIPLVASTKITDIYSISSQSAMAVSDGGQILETQNGGIDWTNKMKLEDVEFGLGFKKINQIEKGFLVINGADGYEGTWTNLSRVTENKMTSYVLARIFLLDMLPIPSKGVLACGVGPSTNQNSNPQMGPVILKTNDYETWSMFFLDVPDCSRCELNVLTKDKVDTYYFGSDNGVLVTVKGLENLK